MSTLACSGCRRARRPRPVFGAPLLVVVAVLGLAVGRGARGSMAEGLPVRPSAVLAPGDSPAEPVPLGEEVTAGPARLRVLDVVLGQEATDRVLAASPTNEPPREGITYVLVRLQVENGGDRPLALDPDDFALTGASGQVRRFLGVQPPDPALAGSVAPGDSIDGWVVLAAPADEPDLLLLYDSLSLPGVWADRVLAVQGGAALPSPVASVSPNQIGIDPTAPASADTPVVTADWSVELLEVASGAEVFDLVDYRTGALGLEDAVDDRPWLALRVRIARIGDGEAAFLPPNAFALVDPAGAPIPDVATLTPPSPDASGAYYPGAVREGWVAFELPLGYDTAVVRFLPYSTEPDPRYLGYG